LNIATHYPWQIISQNNLAKARTIGITLPTRIGSQIPAAKSLVQEVIELLVTYAFSCQNSIVNSTSLSFFWVPSKIPL